MAVVFSFGFVKYYGFPDAENCIRGFTFCGYETSFARESFYAQLKKLSEPQNTNLYVRLLRLSEKYRLTDVSL